MDAREPPQWMLCLDTSAPRTCVALGRVGGASDELIVEDAREDRANQTSAGLGLRLRRALDEVGIDAAQLRLIACGRGPGTFTGSRVAVATAKGLAIGLGVPIVPVSTLAALAASADHEGRVLALLDARREQVYGAVFEVGETIEAQTDERVTELAELVEAWAPTDDLRALGPGCGPYAEQLPSALRERSTVTPGPTARGLWRAAVSALRAGEAVDAGALAVVYLRQSYAQMGINKPKRPVFKSPFV
ncbi:tRNA threonylcarbamoyladenosine biosynthesis protein TsaB [Enhygromyxa salina]|uniref:tRNA threonylcarbamoyladenosine biosynthesis protein TsaB n=1 Tax=Enhygromyxa salina TaxID=215803 RepID=A0A2S9YF70_9BACT|nr:tRNA (adenosine(37)-N6)-threonylcarbamoyltransferase complex dimerization subunit type 1 TsaB [Enhygromyxa salina]PRQ03719.1 tRNA threonylcarbamoyladenosine biosynthesis protein TsaB [Enhygromyxa salina]